MKDKAQAIVNSIENDKAIAEKELEKARPALEEAERALDTIKPADIAVTRRLANPPHLIQRIMDCVLILGQRKLASVVVDENRPGTIKPTWTESLRYMASSNFLQVKKVAVLLFNKKSYKFL